VEKGHRTVNNQSLLRQERCPSFEQFRILYPKDDLCQDWLKLASGSGEVENVKVYRQKDNGRSEKLT
jgi:hypothetical protein